jgi:hypothetical protein
VFTSFVGTKVVLAALAGSLSLGGVATAAVTGSLPGPVQHAAHGAFGVQDDQEANGATPAAQPSESADPTESADPSQSPDPSRPAAPSATTTPTPSPMTGPVGPDASGPAAFGLCHAFGGLKSIRKADSPSTAYRNLLDAATLAGQTVDEYCAAILGTPLPTASATADATKAPSTSSQQRGHGRGPGHGQGHGHGKKSTHP